ALLRAPRPDRVFPAAKETGRAHPLRSPSHRRAVCASARAGAMSGLLTATCSWTRAAARAGTWDRAWRHLRQGRTRAWKERVREGRRGPGACTKVEGSPSGLPSTANRRLTDLPARERTVRAQLLDHVLRDLLHGRLLAREELCEALLQRDADGFRVLAAGHRAQRGDGLTAATGGLCREVLTVALGERPGSRRPGCGFYAVRGAGRDPESLIP